MKSLVGRDLALSLIFLSEELEPQWLGAQGESAKCDLEFWHSRSRHFFVYVEVKNRIRRIC
jgi:hypothetical protein